MLFFCKPLRNQVEVRRMQRQENIVELSEHASFTRSCREPETDSASRCTWGTRLGGAQALPGAAERVGVRIERQQYRCEAQPSHANATFLPARSSVPPHSFLPVRFMRDSIPQTCSGLLSLCRYCSKCRIVWLIPALQKKSIPDRHSPLVGR